MTKTNWKMPTALLVLISVECAHRYPMLDLSRSMAAIASSLRHIYRGALTSIETIGKEHCSQLPTNCLAMPSLDSSMLLHIEDRACFILAGWGFGTQHSMPCTSVVSQAIWCLVPICLAATRGQLGLVHPIAAAGKADRLRSKSTMNLTGHRPVG